MGANVLDVYRMSPDKSILNNVLRSKAPQAACLRDFYQGLDHSSVEDRGSRGPGENRRCKLVGQECCCRRGRAEIRRRNG
jgi:hypothetical protein